MENVSIGMAQDLMVDRLISKVRVKITRSGFTAYIDKRHHEISTDILARKWGVGIDKAKRNFQSTTQGNVRSALKPMTRWYRTDLLSQRLCQLNFIFYIDTLFAKYKSIVENTCAHIFTDGKFVQIIPMKSKSDAGTTLESINQGVRVANKIFMENTPDQTGYNT